MAEEAGCVIQLTIATSNVTVNLIMIKHLLMMTEFMLTNSYNVEKQFP